MKYFFPTKPRKTLQWALILKQGILCGFLFTCIMLHQVATAQSSDVLTRHYDNVLGTSMDITIHGGSTEDQELAADAVLDEIARLEQILSTWRDDSEIMRLNQERATNEASDDLLAVVNACEEWQERSNGAFSCRFGQVVALWNAAEARQERPIVPDMLPTARAVSNNALLIDVPTRRIELDEYISLEPSGLAKGYIIDQAMKFIQRALPDAFAIKLDIGGDGYYWGSPEGDEGWQVGVADPEALADNDNFIATLSLTNMAVATSGHGSRNWLIGDEAFSQILDTRRGWPVSGGLYSVVIAPDALTADAIATYLATQNSEAALKFVNTLENVVAMVIDPQGNMNVSNNWQNYLGGDLRRQANSTLELSLKYTIPNLRTRDYKRPYVAIWVGDAEGRPIKNLLLLGSEQRWAQSNSVWWRRVGRRSGLPANNVTRPTRAPGSYEVRWDGRDDSGNILLQGDYELYLEASREHGGRNYLAIPFTLKEGRQVREVEGEGELGPLLFELTLTLPD